MGQPGRPVAAVVLTVGLLPSGSAGYAQSARDVRVALTGQAPFKPPTTHPTESCFEQLDDNTGTGPISQKFEEQYAAYDSRGADDFTLTTSCTVLSVDVLGTFSEVKGPPGTSRSSCTTTPPAPRVRSSPAEWCTGRLRPFKGPSI